MSILELQKIVREFVEIREWGQFHTPKNLAMALAGEVGELLEIFQWLKAEESSSIMSHPVKARQVSNELADIFIYLLRMADVLNIDLDEALKDKVDINSKKYPADIVRGSAAKYTEYESSEE